MKVLILVASYPPVLESAARLYSQLSENLVKMGHEVTVVTEHPVKESPVDKDHDYYKNKKSRQGLNGVTVLRISPLVLLSKFPGGKALRFILSCSLYFFRGLFIKRPDVILVYSPPLFMGVSAYLYATVRNTKIVFNMQDIHPKVLFDSGVIKNNFIKRILIWMEKISYKKPDAFIVYSEGNKEYLVNKGVTQQIFTINNWIDLYTEDIFDKNNIIRKENNIASRFIVSYAGIIQTDQGLDVIIDAAELLKEYIEIIFIIAGEGSAKNSLQQKIFEKKISNVLMWPVMPKKMYLQFLYESDICLISLSPNIPKQTIPGKLADIMACNKPVIASVNKSGDAAKVIREAECGIPVETMNSKEFSDAVIYLYENPHIRDKFGKNGRTYAEKNFSLDVCTRKFEQVLLSCLRN